MKDREEKRIWIWLNPFLISIGVSSLYVSSGRWITTPTIQATYEVVDKIYGMTWGCAPSQCLWIGILHMAS